MEDATLRVKGVQLHHCLHYRELDHHLLELSVLFLELISLGGFLFSPHELKHLFLGLLSLPFVVYSQFLLLPLLLYTQLAEDFELVRVCYLEEPILSRDSLVKGHLGVGEVGGVLVILLGEVCELILVPQGVAET